jgi:hypothetical protein
MAFDAPLPVHHIRGCNRHIAFPKRPCLFTPFPGTNLHHQSGLKSALQGAGPVVPGLLRLESWVEFRHFVLRVPHLTLHEKAINYIFIPGAKLAWTAERRSFWKV